MKTETTNIVTILALSSVCLWAAVDGTNCNPPAAEETNLPPVKKLESVVTNALPPKVPVYILPRVIIVQTPQGTVIWTEEHHIRELARLFPSGVQTNLVIYNR